MELRANPALPGCAHTAPDRQPVTGAFCLCHHSNAERAGTEEEEAGTRRGWHTPSRLCEISHSLVTSIAVLKDAV